MDQTHADPSTLFRQERAELADNIGAEAYRRARAEALGEEADRAEAALRESDP